MILKNISVRVKDVNKSYVSFTYTNSNAKSRVKKELFLKDYSNGIYKVLNPELLEDELG